MISQEELNFMTMVLILPRSENPFVAAATQLKKLCKPPRMVAWSGPMLLCFIVGYVLMYLQCLHLLYMRVRSKAFKLFQLTLLGLIRIDMPSTTGVVFFLYCPLAVADLALEFRVEMGEHDMVNKAPLFACKFLVILSCSWSFLWVCICQYTGRYAESYSWSEDVQSRRRLNFPSAVRWGLNISFLAASLVPIPIFVWGMDKVNRDFKEIKRICEAVADTLESTAPNYNSTSYSPVQLLNILNPAKALAPLRNDIGVHSRIVLTTGLIDLCLLASLYLPLLLVTLRDIRRRTKDLFHSFPNTDDPEAAELDKIRKRLKQEHVSLVAYAFAAYFSTMMFIPTLAWALSYPGLNFVQDKNWLLGLQIGMHGPFAISGNVILLILNVQARRQFKIYQERKNIWPVDTCLSEFSK